LSLFQLLPLQQGAAAAAAATAAAATAAAATAAAATAAAQAAATAAAYAAATGEEEGAEEEEGGEEEGEGEGEGDVAGTAAGQQQPRFFLTVDGTAMRKQKPARGISRAEAGIVSRLLTEHKDLALTCDPTPRGMIKHILSHSQSQGKGADLLVVCQANAMASPCRNSIIAVFALSLM
jgi:hypothetical protein